MAKSKINPTIVTDDVAGALLKQQNVLKDVEVSEPEVIEPEVSESTEEVQKVDVCTTFRSLTNKFLYVNEMVTGGAPIQFIDGIYKTSDVREIEVLENVFGVFVDEQK